MKTRLKLVTADDFLAEYAEPAPPPSTVPVERILISGYTRRGRPFRPGDWAERLYYAVATYGPNREVQFDPRVTLKVEQGMKCIAIDVALREANPMMFDFLVGFARFNDLAMVDQTGRPYAA